MIKRFTIQHYNIGLVDTKVIETGIQGGDITWLKHKYRDRFFADPFLWYRDEEYYYIFVEEFCFFEDNGKISLLIVDKASFTLSEKIILIEKPYHLSWPFCEENDCYIIPESAKYGKTVKYKLLKAEKKVVSEEIVLDKGLVDPAFFNYNNEEYIFATHIENPKTHLYLYKKGAGKYQLQNTEPLLINASESRSAGNLFIYKNMLLRPVQDCSERYGKETKLMKINNLSAETYDATELISLNSSLNPPYDETLHTFNFYGDIALVDGSKDIFSIRAIYYKFKKLYLRKKRKQF